MSNIIVLSAIVMLVLLFLKVPVFISILAGAALYFAANPNVNDIIYAQRMISANQSTTFLAVPFFAAAGALMNCTGVTRRIMDFCKVITGRMCGGLAQVNVYYQHLWEAFLVLILLMPQWKPSCWYPKWRRLGILNHFPVR